MERLPSSTASSTDRSLRAAGAGAVGAGAGPGSHRRPGPCRSGPCPRRGMRWRRPPHAHATRDAGPRGAALRCRAPLVALVQHAIRVQRARADGEDLALGALPVAVHVVQPRPCGVVARHHGALWWWGGEARGGEGRVCFLPGEGGGGGGAVELAGQTSGRGRAGGCGCGSWPRMGSKWGSVGVYAAAAAAAHHG
jgi:hypothetical protein